MSSGCQRQIRWGPRLSLVAMMLSLTTVYSFLPASFSPRIIRTVHYTVSSGNQERSLYDILGASPKATHAELREKYMSLARKTHPDAIVGKMVKAGTEAAQFSDIAAAWQILSDPKERLRYDRELKAKKFTEDLESLLDLSISTAIPFLRKTADTTFAAAEVTGKNMHVMGQRMGRAKTIFEMESRQRELEQQSVREMNKATQMYTQLETLEKTRLPILTNPNQELNSVKALRILEGFEVNTQSKRSAKQGIESLKVSEREQGKRERELETVERQMSAAENQVKEAIQAEALALQRLEQAKRDVEKAKRDMEASKKKALQAAQREKAAQVELGKAMAVSERNAEKVRSALLQTEDECLERRGEYLAAESSRLADHSEELYMKAQEIAAQVKQRKREEMQP